MNQMAKATEERAIREFLRIAERDTHAYHAATAALDRMVARIAELEDRSPEGPWTADGAHCPTCDCGFLRSANAASAKAKEKK